MIIGRYSNEQTRFLRKLPAGWHLDTTPSRRQRWQWWRDVDALIGLVALLILIVALVQAVKQVAA